MNKSGEHQRARALVEPKRIEAMLVDHPERTSVLNLLYRIALQMDDRVLAADIFAEVEPRLSFEEKLRWLFLGKYHVPIALLFTREWRRIGELSIGFRSTALGEDLGAILNALPDSPDLRNLVQATLLHHSMSMGLVNPRSLQIHPSDLKVAQDFLNNKFASPEMEALCLANLAIRMEQYPALSIWLDNRLKGQDWSSMLVSESASIRREWPYWSRRIEELAGAGDFETLTRMLPGSKWFAGRPRPVNDGYTAPLADSIEEMIWMGFARPLAHQLRFGSQENRLDAGAVTARLLESPPVSKGRDEGRQPFAIPNYRPWTFHAGAVQELWLNATASTLVATLEETPEVSLARCDKYDLPNIHSVTHDSLISDSSHLDFFRLLAEHGEALTEVQRKVLFLRALESKPFTRTKGLMNLPRTVPCYSLAILQLPRQISLDYVVKLAEARLDARPNHAFRLADLGLLHSQAENVAAAVPLLEKSLAILDPSKEDDRSVLSQVELALSRIRQPSAIGRATGPP